MTRLLPLAATLLLAACAAEPPHALGTLERDVVALPAPVFERIAEVRVREGQAVAAGEVLLVFEQARPSARADAARAELERALALRDELLAGNREQTIAAAAARRQAAEAQAAEARRREQRIAALVAQRLLPEAELDQARATRLVAEAEVRAAAETEAELRLGNRAERIAQAEAAVQAARAQVEVLAADLARTTVSAPRAGVVDSLPFEAGDQPAIGQPVATLLVGERPYARVYVPQPLRLVIQVGDRAQVRLEGEDRLRPGRVRALRQQPVYTPHYALAGDDASRLSWLAEVELDDADATLPAGMPVRVTFPDAGRAE